MKTKILFFILPLALILSSCIHSSYRFISYREPGVPMKIYKKVCVFADIEDPFAKRDLELYVGRRLYENGMNTMPAHVVLPPTRERSNEEIHEILVSNSFDGFIKISFEDARDMIGYVPSSSTSTTVVKEKVVKEKDKRSKRDSRDKKKHNYKDVKKKITTEETTVTNRPGYQYSYVLGSLNVRLIDIETSQVAFVQTIHSGGNDPKFVQTSLSNSSVQSRIAETILKGLQKDGFLPKMD